MMFCAKRRGSNVWLTVCGGVLCAVGAAMIAVEQTADSLALCMLFAGVLLLLATPLWLPLYRKGEAARQYDTSDTLKDAVSLTITGTTLTVKNACVEGTVPLAAMTECQQTPAMLALVFGRELTVCIPKRALSETEWSDLLTMVSQIQKG